ncbi:MAG: JAB domain-containing protein [Sphaerochaetaceae bacterium]|nr:JAB domain-containing protein [Sphaerochaetaceae bacterium]
MEVFSNPLRERSTAVIVAHNHPSGNFIPSTDDIRVTQRLIQAGELLGIRVLDHLIFSEKHFRTSKCPKHARERLVCRFRQTVGVCLVFKVTKRWLTKNRHYTKF